MKVIFGGMSARPIVTGVSDWELLELPEVLEVLEVLDEVAELDEVLELEDDAVDPVDPVDVPPPQAVKRTAVMSAPATVRARRLNPEPNVTRLPPFGSRATDFRLPSPPSRRPWGTSYVET